MDGGCNNLLPERTHDECVEDHLARMQQITDGDLRAE